MTDEQIRRYNEKAEANLEKYGYYSTFVLANSTPSFCYSTGIYKSFGIPEIFISSLPPNLSHELIKSYVDKFKGVKTVPFDKRLVDLTDKFPVYLIEVPVSELVDYALATIKFYKNGHFKCVQLIYPDTKGYFPDDAEYDYDQVIMGHFKS